MKEPLLFGLLVKCPHCGTKFRRGYFHQTKLVLDTDSLLTYKDSGVECPNPLCGKKHDYTVKNIAGVEHIPKTTE